LIDELEVMQTRTDPCDWCAGTETYTVEVDDWNRTRNSTEITIQLALGNQCSSSMEIKNADIPLLLEVDSVTKQFAF
jgi:hypothetical protein